MRNPTLLVIFILCVCGCKKSDTSNAIVTAARTTNVFGQTIPTSYDRVTKFYFSSPDTSDHLYYDANGLLGHIDEQIGTDINQLYFSYDNQNRLNIITGVDDTIYVKYGADGKVNAGIETNTGGPDTIFYSYPSTGVVLESHPSGHELDTLYFDTNNNMVRSAYYTNFSGNPFTLSSVIENSYSSIRNPLMASPLMDFFFLLETAGGPGDDWTILKGAANMLSHAHYIEGIYFDDFTLQQHQENANGYPTYLLYNDQSNFSLITQQLHFEY